MNEVGRLLARSQLFLSTLLILGYFGLLFMAGLKLISSDAGRDLTPIVGIVVYFWFQRQRAHSDDDPPNGEPSNPTLAPQAPAKPTP